MRRITVALLLSAAAALASTSAFAATKLNVPDTMAERVKPCVICHGQGNKGGAAAYYPQIAGKPEGYLYNQLRNFRDGRRYYRPMALLLENLSDDYLMEMARYFSTLKQAYPPPERMASTPEEIKVARKLIDEGDSSRKIPPCKECHGKELMGTKPFIPGLLGLSRSYMIAQFGAWRSGGLMRRQSADCMSEIAKQLTAQESNAVAAWIAAQPVPANTESASGLSDELSRRCGLVQQQEAVGQEKMIEAKTSPAAQFQARGAYLARAGNCMGCHTAQGGRLYAGGRSLSTPFGTFITPNITPDTKTGIGQWNADDFFKAMHEGKSRDGRPLYPAFPYTEYTRVTREDSDAIFAHLQAVPPVVQRNPPSQIKAPYNIQSLLSLWRAAYFKSGVYQPDPAKSAEWNRGAYLVQGLGHCSACHAERNPLGATGRATGGEALGGGQIMGSNWYAPSLTSSVEAGSAAWPIDEIVQLLTTGVAPQATTSGPMGEVVRHSLQHLTAEDARAMAVYLKSLPETKPRAQPNAPVITAQVRDWLEQGAKIYKKHCEDCHGASGQAAPDIYPHLAGNRGVILTPPVNAVRIVLNGGYPPSTSGNLRPYGMPPFAQVLNDGEVALVLSYIRNAWGNRASLVTPEQVDKSREGLH
jgi:cytochrome c553